MKEQIKRIPLSDFQLDKSRQWMTMIIVPIG